MGKKNLLFIDDIMEYLEELKEDRDNLICIGVKDTPGSNMPDSIVSRIHEIGFTEFSTELWRMYIGIIFKGKLLLNLCASKPRENLYFESSITEGINVALKSESWKTGNICQIRINQEDFSANLRGINIVVYSETKGVVDSIGYDSHPKAESYFKRKYFAIMYKRYKTLCAISNILPKRIKVRIVYWSGRGGYFWNVFRTVVEEFKKESKYDVKILLYFDDTTIKQILKKEGVSFSLLKEYDFENDKSDILILGSIAGFDLLGFSDEKLAQFRANTSLFIMIELGLMIAASKQLSNYAKSIKRLERQELDYLIVDKLMFDAYKSKNIGADIVVKIGNPKFDGIYSGLVKNELPAEWEKLRTKKKIYLWLIDHDWTEGVNVSFDLYAKSIFEYFANNDDLGLIFRPHPVFLRDMYNYKLWKEEDADELRNYIDNSNNIVWDELSDYFSAYSAADAMMMEVGSGVTLSALATRKPIAILFRNDCKVTVKHPDIIDVYYKCYSEDDMVGFIEGIREGIDPLEMDRIAVAEKYIEHFDGQNGRRIKEFICEKYEEKIAKEKEAQKD